MDQKKVVFVSGCFDVLHGGHIEFFNQAKALGDKLVVCIPTDEVLQKHKNRRPAIPQEHRIRLMKALSIVDEVVFGANPEPGLNFKTEFLRTKPAILAVTEDDEYAQAKTALCKETGAEYVRLPKTLNYEKISSTTIRSYLKAPEQVPLRVDFGGGWLDVPKHSRHGAFIVNCTVTPMVSLRAWDYKLSGGLGGSAAYKILLGENAFASELEAGVGWQDPAIIHETGLCSWHSGKEPRLACKINPEWLKGSMALYWSGMTHNTPHLVDFKRDYGLIAEAGNHCNDALRAGHFTTFWKSLISGVRISYLAQLSEGMKPLPDVPGAEKKYCGSGFGGYALYLFTNSTVRDMFVAKTEDAISVEPYIRSATL